MKVKLTAAVKDSIRMYPKLLKYWPLLVAVHVLGYLGSELFSWQQEEVLSSGREDLLPIIAVFSGAVIIDIVFTTAWIIAVVSTAHAVASDRESRFFSYLNQALIESVRSLARMLRWFPLFIIPGIVKFIRLTFVPYVVADDPVYHEGSVDALDRSEALVKRRFWLVLFALLLSTLLPALPSLVFQGENISLASRPGLSITWSVFEFFTGLLATAFMFCVYRQLANLAE
jgi:hypothetical protein